MYGFSKGVHFPKRIGYNFTNQKLAQRVSDYFKLVQTATRLKDGKMYSRWVVGLMSIVLALHDYAEGDLIIWSLNITNLYRLENYQSRKVIHYTEINLCYWPDPQ